MKKIKVFFNGKPMRDVYPHATRFQVFKYRVRVFFRKLVINTTIAAIFISVGYLAHTDTTHFVQAEAQDTLSEKTLELENELLDTLTACENKANTPIVFDSNAKASVGNFQFQVATVQHFYQTLYNKKITQKEAVLIALDDEKARALAHDVIFKTDKGLSNWYNCTQKHGLDVQLALIKKLK